MQPLVLTLPDSIRDRLEAALDFPEVRDESQLVGAYEHIVRDALLPLHPAPEERDFLRDFQEATLGLHLGIATPAIQLRNLPKHGDTGQHFVLGLNDLLGNGDRFEQPLTTNGAQPMHTDGRYNPDYPCKRLAMIHCVNAGNPVVPTAMGTADELIDHWAQTLSTRFDYATKPDPLQQAKDDLIARLRAVRLRMPRADGTIQTLPLLMDNPNYESGGGAPRMMLTSVDAKFIYTHFDGSGGEAQILERELSTALNGLRNRLSADSVISVEDNTVTLYNDPLVLHARGLTREAAVDAPPEGRLVRAYDMFNSVALRDGEEYNPQVTATGSPISHVEFVERDGSMVLNTRQR